MTDITNTTDTTIYLLPSKVYSWAKWIGLIALPAIATFVSTVGPVWGWPRTDAIVTTINAIGLMVGALIGVSQATAKTN